jgi:hypothetical protein
MLMAVVGIFGQSAELANAADAKRPNLNLLPRKPDYGVFRDE